MPIQKLKFRPGVNRESTTLANEGGWYACDKVRFRSGYPEKIGGWTVDNGSASPTTDTGTFANNGLSPAALPPTGSYWGSATALFNWITQSGANLLALGTNYKYYLQNSVGGYFNDITPIRLTQSLSNCFSAAANSKTITVYAPGHNVQTGDFVVFSGAAGLGGTVTAVVLNAEYQVTYVNSNYYSFTIQTAASSADTGNGGASVTANYQITTSATKYTYGTGWGAGAWGGVVNNVATTALSAPVAIGDTTLNVTSTSGFPSSGTVLLGNTELVSYTSTSGSTFNGCTRGASGTHAQAHVSGEQVRNSATFEAWGTSASTGPGEQLRTWTQANFGDYLVFNPRGSALYIWTPDANANAVDRGQLLAPGVNITVPTTNVPVVPDASCPIIANGVLVSDASRFVITYGVNDYGSTVQNPMLVRWSDQESFATWTPSVTNQAGSYTLSQGSRILSAIQTRQEILMFTDSAVYSMQYVGAPYVWGFQLMGSNTSFISPNAVATVNNTTYWMGADRFYVYTGRVDTLPCTLRQYVYDDINLGQAFQFFAGSNEGYNEVWFFYVSITGPNGTGTTTNPNTVVDRYVIYNHLEQTWSYGTLQRTAWFDSPLRQYPMAANANGQLIYHENGTDDGTTTPPSPIATMLQSSDFGLLDGDKFGFAWRMVPDVNFDGSTTAQPSVSFTILPRHNPGSNYGPDKVSAVTSANNYALAPQYLVQQFTQQIYIRARGRQMALQLTSSGLGVQWQLGVPRFDVRADGRR